MESEEIDNNLDLDEEIESDVIDVEGIAEDDAEIVENEQNISSHEDSILEESIPVAPGSSTDSVKANENVPPEKKRLVRIPLSRVKHVMKMDPDCTLVSQDSVFLVTKATEMFLEYWGKETAKYTLAAKRKTVLKRDIEAAIDSISHLCFLEGALE